MRVRNRFVALLALLFCVSLGAAGPSGGDGAGFVKLDMGKTTLGKETFKGGERACVMLIGDHDPVMDLALYILDEKGQIVAKDTDGGDYCAAIWYPPRDATYLVVAENKGTIWNRCYLVIK